MGPNLAKLGTAQFPFPTNFDIQIKNSTLTRKPGPSKLMLEQQLRWKKLLGPVLFIANLHEQQVFAAAGTIQSLKDQDYVSAFDPKMEGLAIQYTLAFIMDQIASLEEQRRKLEVRGLVGEDPLDDRDASDPSKKRKIIEPVAEAEKSIKILKLQQKSKSLKKPSDFPNKKFKSDRTFPPARGGMPFRGHRGGRGQSSRGVDSYRPNEPTQPEGAPRGRGFGGSNRGRR
jgi:hypothetical protein